MHISGYRSHHPSPQTIFSRPIDRAYGPREPMVGTSVRERADGSKSPSDSAPILKLFVFMVLLPLPALGLAALLGLASLRWLGLCYAALLALEGWFVWAALRSMWRWFMKDEADATREDAALPGIPEIAKGPRSVPPGA